MFPPGSVQISKFWVIPKGTPGKWRLIVDLSASEKFSINDGVDTSTCSLQYVKEEEAAREVAKQGYSAWMAKVDVQHAYRNVPMTGSYWECSGKGRYLLIRQCRLDYDQLPKYSQPWQTRLNGCY